MVRVVYGSHLLCWMASVNCFSRSIVTLACCRFRLALSFSRFALALALALALARTQLNSSTSVLPPLTSTLNELAN